MRPSRSPCSTRSGALMSLDQVDGAELVAHEKIDRHEPVGQLGDVGRGREGRVEDDAADRTLARQPHRDAGAEQLAVEHDMRGSTRCVTQA